MKRLELLRQNYNKIFAALPWLDCYVSDVPCAFDDMPTALNTDYRQLDFTSTNPRLVRQTDHSWEEIEAMAAAEPNINFIIASGERKLVYHYAIIETLLAKIPNLYIATSNLTNEFALERLVAKGLKSKLLYGSMMPCFDAGNTRGMIIFGKMDWETKCAIAGNNFRRLLGEPEVHVPEVAVPEIAPFIIDAHTHTVPRDFPTRFPPYEAEPSWPVWKRKINALWVDDMFVTPSLALHASDKYSSKAVIGDFCRESQGHAFYFEVYDPNHAEETARQVEESLKDPLCIGIKLHPVEQKVYASDPRYEIAFQKAAKYDKAIMSHTWGLSDYNPSQRFGTPDQFAVYLEKYPQVRFVFGHTGGRPNGYLQAAEMCRRFPQTCGDFAGDIFYYGQLHHALKDFGCDRILFASDSYWFDERAMLGMFLEAGLSDEDLWKVLRMNALRIYRPNINS